MIILRLAAIDLRRRLASALLLALVIGLASGISLAALSGARRNQTAYDRFLRESHASDVLVNPNLGMGSVLRPDDLLGLPQVEAGGTLYGMYAVPDLDGKPDLDAVSDDSALMAATDDHMLRSVDRPHLIAGRLPRAGSTTEVAITPVPGGDLDDLEIGSRLAFHFFDFTKIDESADAEPVGTLVRVRVVGIIRTNYDVVSDEASASGTMWFGSGTLRFHSNAFFGVVLRLRHGAADLPALRRSIDALIPDEAKAQGDAVVFQTRQDLVARVERITTPQTIALALFGVLSLLAAWFVSAQALIRHLDRAGPDVPALVAIGANRRMVFGMLAVRAACIALVSAVVALATAVALSPLTPIGLARTIEPEAGVSVNVALLLGAETIAVLALLAAVARPAWLLATRRAGRTGSPATADLLRRVQASPVLAIGIRNATTPAPGERAGASRAAVVGTILSIAALVGATVYGASLAHFVDTPSEWGWQWDRVVTVNSLEDIDEGGGDGTAAVLGVLRRSDEVASVSRGTLTELTLGGAQVTTLALEPGPDGMDATIAAGRAPRTDREVALGDRTLHRLHTSIGETVSGRDPLGKPFRLRVVGQAVFPGLAAYPGEDPTSVGSGALVTLDAGQRLGPELSGVDVYVDYEPGKGAATDARLRKLRITERDRAVSEIARTPQRPSDVQGLVAAKRTPYLLSLVLAGLAVLTLGHALVSSGRARRRESAMLKAIGFERQQLAAIVAWHATAVALCGVVVGAPLGIVVGRIAWSMTTTQLGVPFHPSIPFLLVGLIGVGAIVVANVIAAVPGRSAARTPAAVVLRNE